MKISFVIFMTALFTIGMMGCQQVADYQNEAAATINTASQTAITAKETAERKAREIQEAAAKAQEATEAIGKVVQ